VLDRLFCYGTLEFPVLMHAVIGRHNPAVPAELPGYGRYRVRGENFPGVLPEPGASTPGALYGGLSPAQLRILDRYEGRLYRRRRARVYDYRGRDCIAWIYVIAARECRRLSTEPWDRESFAARYLTDYLRALR
jgi:gamma-glutamylcyclotransferase (GGCT)/AIG2-like uncharacterized protein YtfP